MLKPNPYLALFNYHNSLEILTDLVLWWWTNELNINWITYIESNDESSLNQMYSFIFTGYQKKKSYYYEIDMKNKWEGEHILFFFITITIIVYYSIFNVDQYLKLFLL